MWVMGSVCHIAIHLVDVIFVGMVRAFNCFSLAGQFNFLLLERQSGLLLGTTSIFLAQVLLVHCSVQPSMKRGRGISPFLLFWVLIGSMSVPCHEGLFPSLFQPRDSSCWCSVPEFSPRVVRGRVPDSYPVDLFLIHESAVM